MQPELQKCNKPLRQWKEELRALGLYPAFLVVERCTHKTVDDLETQWIWKLREDGPTFNILDNTEGRKTRLKKLLKSRIGKQRVSRRAGQQSTGRKQADTSASLAKRERKIEARRNRREAKRKKKAAAAARVQVERWTKSRDGRITLDSVYAVARPPSAI